MAEVPQQTPHILLVFRRNVYSVIFRFLDIILNAHVRNLLLII
jgi:hypothetical protein